ncbi:AAA family ATPase [Sphingomonas hankookensis]|uniref:AAA family ATPase n=1 Tax=Sphingomonas hankookensis TaxID=563996 RepID=UPI001F5A8C69|nr:AAA family ATPase [Sphingomonas hankookensis]
MLRIKSLHLKDFGAFKGEQAFDLPSDEGVTVFYGENMRGKTTLLNAFRFALFGKIIGRGRRAVSFHDMINWEARADGARSFEVRLELSHAGADYRLTRTCRPKSGAGAPAGHSDYVADYYLERGGHILPAQQAAIELERILPEQIARFFLFDGELLQEYEDLLHGDTDMGPKISQAIERILGLPTLTKSRDTLKLALDKAEERVAVAAQGDQKTREFGNQLQSLVEEREVLTQDLFRHERDLEGLRAKKVAIEDDMRRRERMATLLDKRDRLAGEVGGLQKIISEKKDDIGKAMAPAWSAIIRPRLVVAVTAHRAREVELQSAVTRAQVLHSLAEGHEASCPTCLQTVPPEAQAKIRAMLPSGQGSTDEAQRELGGVRRRLDALEAQLAVSNPEALRLLWADLEAKRLEMYAKSAEIEEIEKQLTGDAEDELKGLRRDYDSIVRQIAALEEGIKATNEKLAGNANYRDNIQKRLDKLAGGQMDSERRRRDMASRLYELFKDSVDVYRDQLRHRVEADASRYFKLLTTEQDYAGLRINDSYGLMIVHRDGSDIPVRSAGAEHVVALSLVAALQNNAQLRGPIVIDSPFGRLDGGHRSRIVEVLPDMADQVVLLVYEEELPPARAREALKGRLRSEWALERQSARHTELVKR